MNYNLESVLGAYAAPYFTPFHALPPRGALTWSAEGHDNPESPYFSRRAHWPGGRSGLTIGRGYDLGSKSTTEAYHDLTASGVSSDDALKFAINAGKKGKDAEYLVRTQQFPLLSVDQEQRLFAKSFQAAEASAAKLLVGSGRNSAYQWSNIPPLLREIFIDLRYRGDLTNQRIQSFRADLATGNYPKIVRALLDANQWVGYHGLTQQRFQLRRDFIERYWR